jgi:hypothetical protein
MANIRLVDAAKHFKGLSHQIAAWNQLQEQLTASQLKEFADTYRAGPDPAQVMLRPGSSFDTKITPNITYGEVALQSEARRFTAQHQCNTAVLLCQFAQKARDHFKRPVIITSGYRPPKINAQVGGASRSEHLYDAPDTGAIDFYLDGMSVRTLQDWADKEWPYSLGYGAPKGFIHLGVRPGRARVRWDY